MIDAHLEVLVEPFRENDPGPHVTAVVDAATAAGLEPDMGPFATMIDGDIDRIADAIGQMVRSGMTNGATAIQIRVELA